MTRQLSYDMITSVWDELAVETYEPVLETLRTHGPLNALLLKYFMKREHDTVIDHLSVLDLLTEMVEKGHPVSSINTPGGNRSSTVWCITGDEERPRLNVPVSPTGDYTDAYVTLYLRYQAIRNNPELATVSEDYIDAIYNPTRPAEGEQ